MRHLQSARHPAEERDPRQFAQEECLAALAAARLSARGVPSARAGVGYCGPKMEEKLLRRCSATRGMIIDGEDDLGRIAEDQLAARCALMEAQTNAIHHNLMIRMIVEECCLIELVFSEGQRAIPGASDPQILKPITNGTGGLYHEVEFAVGSVRYDYLVPRKRNLFIPSYSNAASTRSEFFRPAFLKLVWCLAASATSDINLLAEDSASTTPLLSSGSTAASEGMRKAATDSA